MNIWDIILLVLLALIVGLAVRSMLRRRSASCTGQCEGCHGCPYARR